MTGLKIAYLALQRARKAWRTGNLDDQTAYQMFFKAFAQSWRRKMTLEVERNTILMDERAPPRFRVRGAVAHMPEFRKAFSCQTVDSATLNNQSLSIW